MVIADAPRVMSETGRGRSGHVGVEGTLDQRLARVTDTLDRLQHVYPPVASTTHTTNGRASHGEGALMNQSRTIDERLRNAATLLARLAKPQNASPTSVSEETNHPRRGSR